VERKVGVHHWGTDSIEFPPPPPHLIIRNAERVGYERGCKVKLTGLRDDNQSKGWATSLEMLLHSCMPCEACLWWFVMGAQAIGTLGSHHSS
jgi:hypothetical protein